MCVHLVSMVVLEEKNILCVWIQLQKDNEDTEVNE